MEGYKDYLQRRCAAGGFSIDSILSGASPLHGLPPFAPLGLPFHPFSFPSFLPHPDPEVRFPPLQQLQEAKVEEKTAVKNEQDLVKMSETTLQGRKTCDTPLLKSKKEEIARKEWTMGWGPRD